MTLLNHLVANAVALGGGDLCAAGHDWISIGGRSCPSELTELCSQPVFECARCGAMDYGDQGGPGYQSCATVCQCGWHALREA